MTIKLDSMNGGMHSPIIFTLALYPLEQATATAAEDDDEEVVPIVFT